MQIEVVSYKAYYVWVAVFILCIHI